MHPLEQRGAELLAAIAADPHSDDSLQFDAHYYEFVWKFLRSGHATFAARVARYLSVEGVVAGEVLPNELDEVAHDATNLALRRVRRNAARFDPSRGTATGWLLGAAEMAYVEVVKEVAKARRSDRLAFVAPEELLDEHDYNPSTEEHVVRQADDADVLAEVAELLAEREYAALRLCVMLGYSYAEAATVIFGDDSMAKQVDGLLTRGKAKLAAAWNDRRPSPSGASSSKVSEAADDMEGR